MAKTASAVISYYSHVQDTTLWHWKHGRPLRREVAAQKHYLTPSEGKILADYTDLHAAWPQSEMSMLDPHYLANLYRTVCRRSFCLIVPYREAGIGLHHTEMWFDT
jgi:hypothetical protein